MAVLIKKNGQEKPDLMTITKNENDNNVNITYASINVNIIELTDGTFEWDCLELPGFALNNIHKADNNTKYSVLVAHIIKAYYNDNQMTAIMNNYLLEPEDESYKNEFNKMQKIRKLAKDTAKTIMTEKLI